VGIIQFYLLLLLPVVGAVVVFHLIHQQQAVQVAAVDLMLELLVRLVLPIKDMLEAQVRLQVVVLEVVVVVALVK
jgi:hypothetical protein